MKNKICYLCGKPGADSKDHVPSKGLLPESQYNKYQRITLPAHRSCNSDASDNEEYVRDLLIMEAEALSMPKFELITPKVWRAWSTNRGYKRYSEIIKTAKPIEIVTKSGIFIKKAITVEADQNRIISVGRKIVKGMIYHDSGAIIDNSDLYIYVTNIDDLIKIRERDSKEHFWTCLCSEHCLHDICADTVAIRRFYECINEENENKIFAYYIVMLWNCILLSELKFPIKYISNKEFKFFINTNYWRKI